MTLMLTSHLTGLLAGMASGGSEAAEEGQAWMPFVAGGVSLGILLIALIGLLIFGKGREHS
jgi:hypothetical protein